MKTIKIIDLLNKIANGEKYPKIKFNNNVYKYHDKEHGYCRHYYDNTYICLNSEYHFFDILNDEVEIIEEEKKIPEKIYWDVSDDKYTTYINGKKCKACRDSLEELSDMYRQKINELLDYLESKEKGE